MTGFFWPIKSVNTNIKAATLVAATAFLVSCGTPERLPQDVSIDQSKRVVEDRILAPLSRDNVSTALLPEKKPRRQLLQVRYHEESLTSANFISDLRRLSSTYAGTLPSDNELKVLTGYSQEPVDEPVIAVTPEPVAKPRKRKISTLPCRSRITRPSRRKNMIASQRYGLKNVPVSSSVS